MRDMIHSLGRLHILRQFVAADRQRQADDDIAFFTVGLNLEPPPQIRYERAIGERAVAVVFRPRRVVRIEFRRGQPTAVMFFRVLREEHAD